MNLLEQEKQRLLREYDCATITQVLEVQERLLNALKNPVKPANGTTSARAIAEQPSTGTNAPEPLEKPISPNPSGEEPLRTSDVYTGISYIGSVESSRSKK